MTAAPIQHIPEKNPGDHKSARQIHRHLTTKGLDRHIDHGACLEEPCIIQDNVRGAERGAYRGRHLLDSSLIRHIAGKRPGFRTVCTRQITGFPQALFVTRHKSKAGVGQRRKRLCGSAAHPLACSGYQYSRHGRIIVLCKKA